MKKLDIQDPLKSYSDLEVPIFSKNQIDAHLVHHKKYYDNLCIILDQQKFNNWNIEELLKYTSGSTYNTVAQYWYHNLFWDNLVRTGEENSLMTRDLLDLVNKNYTSVENLKSSFVTAAVNHFGSGWISLNLKKDSNTCNNSLVLKTYRDAETSSDQDLSRPLLVIDLWEHSYYLDFKYDKKQYLEKIWDCVNWSVVGARLIRAI